MDPLCILVLNSSSSALLHNKELILLRLISVHFSLQGNWAGAGIVLILTVNDRLVHSAT